MALLDGVRMQDLVDIKRSLIQVHCPLLKSEETSDQVAALLLEPSKHRDDLLNWIGNVIFEEKSLESPPPAPTKRCLQQMESVLMDGASEFLTAKSSPREQIHKWKILMRLLKAANTDANGSGLCQWALEFQEFLINTGHAAPLSAVDKGVGLVPRDLERKIKSNFKNNLQQNVSIDDLRKISESCNSQLRDLEAEESNEQQKTEGPEQPTYSDLSVEERRETFLRLRKSMSDFRNLYTNDLMVWAERVPKIEETKCDKDLNDSISKIHVLLKELKQSSDNRLALRDSVKVLKLRLQDSA